MKSQKIDCKSLKSIIQGNLKRIFTYLQSYLQNIYIWVKIHFRLDVADANRHVFFIKKPTYIALNLLAQNYGPCSELQLPQLQSKVQEQELTSE